MQRRAGHVLVVDDDALNRRLVTATLAREGLRTTSANDGAEALKAIGEDPPDVILLDIEMPGMDGFEVLEHIKSDETLRHLPVIMISGLDDTESVVRCLEIGADDFLPKPFDAAILRARINAGLRPEGAPRSRARAGPRHLHAVPARADGGRGAREDGRRRADPAGAADGHGPVR